MYPEESIAAALSVWEQAVKHYKKHWHVWTSFIDFLVYVPTDPLCASHVTEGVIKIQLIPRNTVKDFPRTRKAFKEFSGSHLAVDYPEAVYDAWISFEERWGGQKELHDALTRVKKLGDALADKRARVSVSVDSLKKFELTYPRA